MKIEAMEGYPRSLWVMIPPKDNNIAQLQGHISTLTNKIQELTLPREGDTGMVYWLLYRRSYKIECPRLRGAGPPTHPMVPPPVGPLGGVVQVTATMPFHGLVQYHAFFESSRRPENEYCEIYRSHGNSLRHFPILQKYIFVPNTIYCEFCGSPTHTTNQCRALDALANRLDRSTFRVNETPQGFGGGH
jgi:hypothetical protein